VSLRRLRPAEWLAGAGGVALLIALFSGWYGFRGRSGAVNGFEALTVIDLLLAALALLALALPLLVATATGPAAPVGAGVLAATFGPLGVLLVVFRLIVQPGPNEFVTLRFGAWLALGATLAIAVAGWLAIRDERSPHVPPGPEPELRPSP
jgi:hypothetical protein